MQYTETELAKLIETVEKEFTTHLNKAEEAQAALAKSEGSASGTLAKADDSAPPKEKKESKDKEAKAPESKEAAPKEDGASKEAPAAEAKDGEEAAPAAEGQPAAAAPAAAASAEAGHGYDDEDMAHMLKMYQSMSREELLAHHDCVRQCLDAQGAAEQAAPAAAAEAAAPAAAPAGLGKSEIKDENPVLNSKPTDKGSNTNAAYNKNSGGKQSKTGEPKGSPGAKSSASTEQGNLDNMEKSENAEFELVKSELEAEKAKSAELKKSFDKATEVLAALVKKVVPQGKAITEVAALAKSEDAGEVKELTKSEVKEILMKKASDPKLTKADRDAINSFYLGGSNYNTISHLLKN